MRLLLTLLFVYACIITDIYIETKRNEQKIIEFTNYVYIPNAIEKCESREVITYDFLTMLNYYANE